MKQTFKKAGYKYIGYDKPNGIHILLNIKTGMKEAFTSNKHHASWGLKYKNTHLEFCYSF